MAGRDAHDRLRPEMEHAVDLVLVHGPHEQRVVLELAAHDHTARHRV
jgi:hypothetical protein